MKKNRYSFKFTNYIWLLEKILCFGHLIIYSSSECFTDLDMEVKLKFKFILYLCIAHYMDKCLQKSDHQTHMWIFAKLLP